MQEFIKSNKNLVTYFTTSEFWNKQLNKWSSKNSVKHGLSKPCETQWYSMSKVCLGVETHEEGFKNFYDLLLDPSFDTPSMTNLIITTINNWDHFTSNSALVELLRPVVDAIANLEHSCITLEHIWKIFIETYSKIKKKHGLPQIWSFQNSLHQCTIKLLYFRQIFT